MRSPGAAGLTVRLTSLMALALKLCPQSSSLIAVTLRVETPLDVHLSERCHQRLLAALVALKYPLAGLGIYICCLIFYLKPEPLGEQRSQGKAAALR